MLPANAMDDSVTWSIESGSGANINASGLLTATAAGSVTVRATANDGSGVYGERTITITEAPPAFVPVTSITGVPTTATAGTPLTLTGTVTPADATNQTIVWSVKNAGAAGATVSGNTLSTTEAGTVTVTAAIVNGATESTDYTQDFEITVSAAPITTYTVTFNSNGSVYATKTAIAGQSLGSGNFPANPERSNYTFGGWFTGENGAGTQFTAATPVNAAMTVYAKWTYNGGGGNGGGGTPTPDQKPIAEVTKNSKQTEPLQVNVDKDDGSASVDVGSINGNIIVTIPSIPDVDTYKTGIPVSGLKDTGRPEHLTVNTDAGSIKIPFNMLTGVRNTDGQKAEIVIGEGDKSALPPGIRNKLGDRPLVQLTLLIDGKQTDWKNNKAPVTVSIPYKPTAQELRNPNGIVVWYIDGDGKAVSVPNGRYDSETGMVTFTTTHFSDYAVVYNNVSFNDVSETAWYAPAVSFIAAREITTGTGNNKYSPEAKLTRGEFIVLMMRAYGIAPDENPTDNFADAGNTYYTGYLAAAKRLGISAGIGSNRYAPGNGITRQEMFTLLYNALKVIEQLPENESGKTLTDFTDAGQISLWAQEAMTLLVKAATVGGSSGKLTPTATTTRAEMAQVLYNLMGK